jgi:hypothetical protein
MTRRETFECDAKPLERTLAPLFRIISPMETAERDVYAGLLNTIVKLLNEKAGNSHDNHIDGALAHVNAARTQYLQNDPMFMASLLLGIADLVSIEDRDMRKLIAGHISQKVILP